MRAAWLSCILGIALGCGGDPFIATSGSNGAAAGTAGTPASGGTTAGPGSGGSTDPTTTPPENTAAQPNGIGGGSGGASSTPDGRKPSTGGGATDAGGAPEGGEGGAADAPKPVECPSATAGDWELGYFPELRDATTQESHPFFKLTNRGAITTLDRIAIRYYFTKESDLPETGVCFWVTGDRCSLAQFQFGSVPAPTTSATRYLEVTFPRASHVKLAPGSLEVRVGFKTGAETLLQTNDYSFDPNSAPPSFTAPFPYKRWPQATLYIDGKLTWGTEPCASGNAPSPP
jgi:hypothetical protein